MIMTDVIIFRNAKQLTERAVKASFAISKDKLCKIYLLIVFDKMS